ncbi:hypothetical protein HCI99_06270 [Listeria booriae]|uniref:Uncharacterized protein n=1 Tax=Listeria booriae TaxID=1552123 RepID=A0A7X0XC81_9LIST|nr:hypothetical protein [Listeria booriae]MBC1491427.1 hypothetical protein [Listeria booriae]
MNTSEFKAILDEMDLAVYESESAFIITEDELNWDIANVSKDYERIMSIEENTYEAIGSEQTCELFELLTAYASTPLSEREEPKKWYLRDPVISDTGCNYLNINYLLVKRDFMGRLEGGGWQTKFTRAEIDAFEFEHAHLIEEEVTE